MKVHIDADAYITTRGGVSETARFLTSRGFSVSRACVSKWGRLQMIPMRAMLRIWSIEGPKFDPRTYFVVTK